MHGGQVSVQKWLSAAVSSVLARPVRIGTDAFSVTGCLAE